MKIEDLKDGMVLVGVKDVYCVREGWSYYNVIREKGEEEVLKEFLKVVKIGGKYRVFVDEDGDVYLEDEDGIGNEGRYVVGELIGEDSVFEIF